MPTHLAAYIADLQQATEAIRPEMARALSEHASTCLHRLRLEVVPSTDSTNAELMRRARAPSSAPTLLVAANQTAGRGRMGKTWMSQAGDSLTFSILLPLQPTHWTGLSLAVGVSVVDALAQLLPPLAGKNLRLKWPNDLWLFDSKLAGILVEVTQAGHTQINGSSVVVGVGINLKTPVLPEPPLVWTGVPPTGLHAHQADLTPGAVLRAVAPALLRDLLAFESLGFSAFTSRFALRDALHNQVLVLSDGTQGMGAGVDEQGALRIHTTTGLHTVHSAEVSVRPLRLDSAIDRLPLQAKPRE